MAVLKSCTYTTRCPFSKKLIKPSQIICLFNEKQFNAFKVLIYEKLKFLPNDIIELIIKKTGYEKLVYDFGHEKFAHWTIESNTESKIKNLQYSYKCENIDDSESSNSD